MTVDTQTIRNLLSCNENDRIDFKQEFYDLSGDTKEQKNAKAAAMIKDILSLCNTIRNESAYIVCGVREEGNVRIVCGLTNLPPDDADLQGKLSARTTPVPKFQLRTRTFENKWIAIIEIPVFPYSTPPTSTKDLPGIVQNQVYIRRGSRNSEANPQEIFLITQWLRNLERAFFPTLTPLDPNLRFNEIRSAKLGAWDESPAINNGFPADPFAHLGQSKHFRLANSVSDDDLNPSTLDPIFNITIGNSVGHDAVLFRIGLRLVAAAHVIYGLGAPPLETRPLRTSDIYEIDVTPLGTHLREQPRAGFPFKDLPWIDYFQVTNVPEIWLPIQDPLLLPQHGFHRFDLVLKNYCSTMPNHVRIQILLKSDQTIIASEPLDLFLPKLFF